MAGDVACACAFVCYAGPFNADFRMLLLKERFYKDFVDKKIPVTPNVDVAKFMVDENTIGDWAREGLPRDELSIQNGIMVTRASKWPLLIDPQGQGLGWIKRRDEVNRLRITELTEKRFCNALEDSMAFGEHTETFRMYMTTRMGNPHFSPELCAQVSERGGVDGAQRGGVDGARLLASRRGRVGRRSRVAARGGTSPTSPR
jgi:dynein heavy chain